LPISSVSHGSQRALCARETSKCAVSSIEAMPASIAGVLTLKGPRMRLTASTTGAGAYIQPRGSAASAWILEKVRVITTLSLVATSSMPDS
jgi:hypothetical protein